MVCLYHYIDLMCLVQQIVRLKQWSTYHHLMVDDRCSFHHYIVCIWSTHIQVWNSKDENPVNIGIDTLMKRKQAWSEIGILEWEKTHFIVVAKRDNEKCFFFFQVRKKASGWGEIMKNGELKRQASNYCITKRFSWISLPCTPSQHKYFNQWVCRTLSLQRKYTQIF